MDTKTLELELNLLHERICAALADPKRILMLYLLAEGGMYVNEISEQLNMPQSTVSRHLRVQACQMSMGLMGIKQEELPDGIETVGVATFIHASDESNATIFI